MNGPGLVCAGCSKPTSLYKPVCDDCMRASGQEPSPEWQLQLIEIGARAGKIYGLLDDVKSATEWNERVRVGGAVIAKLDDGTEFLTTTRSAAWDTRGGRVGVLLNVGTSPGYWIDQLRAVVWSVPGKCMRCSTRLVQRRGGGDHCQRCED